MLVTTVGQAASPVPGESSSQLVQACLPDDSSRRQSSPEPDSTTRATISLRDQYWQCVQKLRSSQQQNATRVTTAASTLSTAGAVAEVGTGHITGTVTDSAGNPLGGGAAIYQVIAWQWSGSAWNQVTQTVTDANGNYDLSGLNDGSYRIEFNTFFGWYHATEFYNDAAGLDSATDVEVVGSGTVANIDAELADAGFISGTVTGSSGGVLQMVSVFAHEWDGSAWSLVDFAHTDSNGEYSIGGLFTRDYRVQFNASPGNWEGEVYDNAIDLDSGTDVPVTLGATTAGIDAELVTPVSSVPPPATLAEPMGLINTSTPTYIWNAAANAEQYYLWVNDASGNRIKQWYTAAEAGCDNGAATCSVTPGIDVSGASRWFIQTWNNVGFGPWSFAMDFSIAGTIPPEATTVRGPTGSIGTTMPGYFWDRVPEASWYYLWVNDSTGNRIKKWYGAADIGCAGVPTAGAGGCRITPTKEVKGAVQWWVRTWNSNGSGPWSNPGDFTVNGAIPGAATPASPNGTISDSTPTYSWDAVAGATWYYLWVDDSNGNRIKTWYSATELGCAGGMALCSITPTTVLRAGSSQWWIQTWNIYGSGPWSAAGNFDLVPVTVP